MRKYRSLKIWRILFILFTLTGMGISADAQPFNNEWINFNNTYYKFKVGKDSLYQIPLSTLQNAGLQSIPVEQFRLYRNGVEVPLYTSVASGPLPANGYLEFLGKANDGEPDRPLYRLAKEQHVTDHNLHSDTAVYFLTVEPTQPNKRYVTVTNDIAANTLPVEPYFLHRTGKHYKEQINTGFAADVVTEYIYSSAYDRGEFWSSWDITERQTRGNVLSNLKAVTNGPNAIINYGAFGKSVRTRRIKLDVNGKLLQDTALNYFSDLVSTVSFPASDLATGTANVNFTNVQPPPTPTDSYADRMVLSFFDLIYPREFDFNNSSSFYFELEARTFGYYLEIKNFNAGAAAPVLYDMQTMERYVGNTAQPGVIRFALRGSSSSRKMMLVSGQAGTAVPVTTLTQKVFTDFSNGSNQGDYLIVSNPRLYTSASGSNPVEAYRQYRSSAQGGGHAARVYDINELTDQFAFGIKGHPLSVRNFVRFAVAKFSTPVTNLFLIGKGVDYAEYKYVTDWNIPTYAEQPRLEELNLVPTFGYPGSDIMLVAFTTSSPLNMTNVGRLSVINGTEVENYLEKVKQYEQAQQTAPNTVLGRLWMKDVLHITGASDAFLGQKLCDTLTLFKTIIEDTLVGAKATLLCKTSSAPTDNSGTETIRASFEKGMGMLTYFGHSSASTLEFNIEDPKEYNNQGKYPVFSVMGCYAGNLFQYDLTRFADLPTLSEKFTLIPQKGSIAFLASSHFGIVQYLNTYLNAYYQKLTKTDYGATLGKIHADALAAMMQSYGNFDFLARTHAEQLCLHGDPAIVVNYASKPDYDIEESFVSINPALVSVADRTFKLKVKYYNLGKAIKDSVGIEIKRTLPDGTIVSLYNQKRPAAYYVDSLEIDVPVVSVTDRGANKISIVIDGKEQFSEVDELNNSITKSFFIYEDGLAPIFPYNYAIVSNPAQKLFASTANPFSPLKQYALEIDTTMLFNSPLKKSILQTSKGGILEFDPQMSFLDSTVYYWRTAMVPADAQTYIWGQFSFFFRNNSLDGFDQAHYFQHLKSDVKGLALKDNRVWEFDEKVNNVTIKQAMYPTSGTQEGDFAITINDDESIKSACVGRSLLFNVIDPLTFKPWLNVDASNNNLFRFGSGVANCKGSTIWNFEFSFLSPAGRKLIMDFMDSIPAGYYVIVRSIDYNDPNSMAPTWQSDTALYGSNNSLYHKLIQAGMSGVDQLTTPKCWSFMYKKGDPKFSPQTTISAGIYDKIAMSLACASPGSLGNISSPDFGPAKAWKELHWKGHPIESSLTDNVKVSVFGKTINNTRELLKEFSLTEQNVDISDIDAAKYPYLILGMRNSDSINYTPYQLDFWKLVYDPVPEGGVAPNIFFSTSDTVQPGAIVNFGIAFKNVSKVAFDSIKIKVIITDRNNVAHELPQSLLKPLVQGDTVIFRYGIDTKSYTGLNTIFIEFNPDNHQPEQYHFNNFLYRNLYVSDDKTKPILDVTFDGAHILSGDIVSAKPMIQIKLKDESKFLLLKDTSLLRVRVKFPDGKIRTYRYDNDTVKFTPAVSSADNTATIEFSPSFLQTYREDGIDNYELSVSGKDASNNPAGNIDYSINFLVINKPMISNLLNYPNPFTTSTAFVFTITGSEIPSNFKIQILTVTGKVVREITGPELGPLRIGRNITEFKWDGTDQFGQRLANGVYLYRVITMLNGKKMDKFKADGDNTDKFFTNGYGKMYLMR